MTTVEALKAARALIEDPARWTREEYARDEKGRPVNPLDPRACKFCALGAARKASGSPLDDNPIADALGVAADEMFQEIKMVHRVNDFLGHPAVLKIYDKAIELAEAEEATR